MPDQAIWLPTGADLETVAVNIGLKRPPEPAEVLDQIAGLLADQGGRTHTAGMLYKIVAMTRPYADDSRLFALEAARVILVANGFPAARISRDRADRLWADVEAGTASTVGDIGRRLTEL